MRPNKGNPAFAMKRKTLSSLVFASFGHIFVFAISFVSLALAGLTCADETCSSPYLARIDGQEEFIYVWTLGVEGLGGGMDKVVTGGVKPGWAKHRNSASTFC